MIMNLMKEYEPDELFYPKEQEALWNKFGQKAMFDEYAYCIRHQEKKQPSKVSQDLALLLTTSGSTGSPKLVDRVIKISSPMQLPLHNIYI